MTYWDERRPRNRRGSRGDFLQAQTVRVSVSHLLCQVGLGERTVEAVPFLSPSRVVLT